MISQTEQFELLAREKGFDIFKESETLKFRFIWVSPKHREHAFGVVFARSFFDAFKKAVEVNDILKGLEVMTIRFENPMVFYGNNLVARLTVMLEDSVELSITSCLREAQEIVNG
jgi:hypothetical protein